MGFARYSGLVLSKFARRMLLGLLIMSTDQHRPRHQEYWDTKGKFGDATWNDVGSWPATSPI